MITMFSQEGSPERISSLEEGDARGQTEERRGIKREKRS